MIENHAENMKRSAMSEIRRDESYIESDSESRAGHEDTRRHNFECEHPDRNLGCDPGIDVAG